MKTIGTFLQQARQKAHLSVEEVSIKTKIRLDYLQAIESDSFDKLPSATFVKGFIRNYAIAVDLDPEKALAIFRRDFDHNEAGKVVPRGLSHPIPTSSKFWHPRTTSFIALGVMLVAIGFYFINQLFTLWGGPTLEVIEPDSQAVLTATSVTVRGRTQSDALVLINNQPIGVNAAGEFETNLLLDEGEHTIMIEAEDRDGKRTQVVRTVTVELE